MDCCFLQAVAKKWLKIPAFQASIGRIGPKTLNFHAIRAQLLAKWSWDDKEQVRKRPGKCVWFDGQIAAPFANGLDFEISIWKLYFHMIGSISFFKCTLWHLCTSVRHYACLVFRPWEPWDPWREKMKTELSEVVQFRDKAKCATVWWLAMRCLPVLAFNRLLLPGWRARALGCSHACWACPHFG